MNIDPKIFRAYDVRGIYPEELNEEIVYAVAQAYVDLVHPQTVVIGHDVRMSGPSLAKAAIQGFVDAGVDVIDIGQVSTDMVYFVVAHYGYDGGVAISASHNPREYNGVKMVRKDAIPIAGDSGILQIRDFVLSGRNIESEKKGSISTKYFLDDYCKQIASFIHIPVTKRFKIVANANFGMSGIALRRLIEIAHLPIDVIDLNFTPDGTFPKGRPDPMIPELRIETENKIREVGADFGVAWDGDADRIFFYNEHGDAYEGYFSTVVLATYFWNMYPHSTMYCDPRLIWAMQELAARMDGRLVIARAGHSFIKETMRKEEAIFGGETSGHYYFKDNYYADNGMIPFVIMLQLLMGVDHISVLYAEWVNKYFIPGEQDIEVASMEAGNDIIQKVKEKYLPGGKLTEIDGLSLEYPDWRFNLRPSNTEPLIRLNLESRSKALTDEKTKELMAYIQSCMNDGS